jgi:hypothetical protein
MAIARQNPSLDCRSRRPPYINYGHETMVGGCCLFVTGSVFASSLDSSPSFLALWLLTDAIEWSPRCIRTTISFSDFGS